ncbi:MAG: DNA helicase PcrA [Bacillota bacterium]
MQFPWLNDLNEAQRAAVQHVDGPLLIIAGAGSGKTRVLTYRMAYLLAQGVPPSAILAVTFTNKAANEMKERVEALIGPQVEQVWVGTFHAACVRILRRHADRIGFPHQFLIFDTSDQLTVMRTVLQDLNLDPKRYDPRGLLSAVSAAKNNLVGPEQYAETASDFWERTVARVYARYQEKLRENGAFDFDDLLLKTVELFRQAPDVLQHYRDRFRYLMIDEYQDTNRVQYVLVNMLAAEHRNLCVVGDADQSIYRFRGADIRNILDFERDYPDARVIKLEQNYRSTKRILAAANAVIANNLHRPEKTLWTANPEGDPIYFYRARDERGEAAFVADEIRRSVLSEGRPYSDFTILYRTHAQSRTFEEEFIRRGIPYRIVSGVRFYERKEIKDLLAYLRVIYNPLDEFSLRRIINVPKRGIGDATMGRLDEFAALHGMSLYEAMTAPEALAGLSGAAAKKVEEFADLLEELRQQARELPLTALVERVLERTGYLAELMAERTLEAEARIENLREFLSVTRQFEQEQGGGLGEFLEHVALVSDVDAYDAEANSVTMMTLHAAKGLEFPVVFLVGMEDGIFPHSRALAEPEELEEERRLCYVGMTRAKERLYLTCARQRLLYGQTVASKVSMFVGEVPQELVEDLSSDDDYMAGFGGSLWYEADRFGTGRWGGDSYGAGAYEPGGYGSGRSGNGAESGYAYGGRPAGRGVAPAGPVRFGAGDLRTAGAGGPGRPRPSFDPSTLQAGDKVRHAVFGEGTVVSCAPAGSDTVVTVAFPEHGVKKLLASVAPLEKV